jgi:hypothetical protein
VVRKNKPSARIPVIWGKEGKRKIKQTEKA